MRAVSRIAGRAVVSFGNIEQLFTPKQRLFNPHLAAVYLITRLTGDPYRAPFYLQLLDRFRKLNQRLKIPGHFSRNLLTSRSPMTSHKRKYTSTNTNVVKYIFVYQAITFNTGSPGGTLSIYSIFFFQKQKKWKDDKINLLKICHVIFFKVTKIWDSSLVPLFIFHRFKYFSRKLWLG